MLTAMIIAGVFFLFLLGISVDAFIRNWIDEERKRSAGVRIMYARGKTNNCGN